MAPKQEYYLPQTYFTTMGGISTRDFDRIQDSGDPLVRPTSDGFPVFGIMQYLYKQTQTPKESASDSADDMLKLKYKKEEQLLLQIALKNIGLMKLFVLKETAESRMIESYNATALAIKSAVLNVSSKLKGDTRENQEMLTAAYNEALADLYANAEHVEWDDHDDSLKIKQKIMEFSRNDTMLTALIENAYGS